MDQSVKECFPSIKIESFYYELRVSAYRHRSFYNIGYRFGLVKTHNLEYYLAEAYKRDADEHK